MTCSLLSTRACPLYPWTIPCDVTIKADSLSVTLLLISRPCFPIFASWPFSHLSRRSAFFCNFSICLLLSPPPEGRPPPSSSSSLLSHCSCSSSNPFTFFSRLSFFLLSSWIVPLHSLDALDRSLHPSRAKKVPPSNPSSSQTNSTSLNRGRISPFIDETKAAIVL